MPKTPSFHHFNVWCTSRCPSWFRYVSPHLNETPFRLIGNILTPSLTTTFPVCWQYNLHFTVQHNSDCGFVPYDLMINKTVLFCWVPSHVGIRGNELADAAAKAALNERLTIMTLPYPDFKPLVKRSIRGKWSYFLGYPD